MTLHSIRADMSGLDPDPRTLADLQAQLEQAEDLNAFTCIGDLAGFEPTATGPLAGVPFAVKDNIDTSDLPTAGGTEALRGSRPHADAPVVAALRAAGGVLVGKTNLHELALGITSRNGSFGAVVNPAAPTRSPGGSSGGSAAAVAAGLVPFALGTDTGGSVRIPAAHCGIIGMRPTTGRYLPAGVLRISPTRDTIGILARHVSDVAYVDSLLTHTNPLASTSAPDLGGARIGVPWRGYFDDLDPCVASAARAALDAMDDAGAHMVDVDLHRAQALDDLSGFPIVFYEIAREVPRYLATLDEPYRTLRLSDLARTSRSTDVADTLRQILEHPVSDEAYRAARTARADLCAEYQRVFAESDICAIAYPTVPIPPPPQEDTDSTMLNGRSVPLFTTTIRNTSPTTLAGTPAISIPCGRSSEGLPIGLSLEGLPGEDLALLRLALTVEPVLRPASRAHRDTTAHGQADAHCSESHRNTEDNR